MPYSPVAVRYVCNGSAVETPCPHRAGDGVLSSAARAALNPRNASQQAVIFLATPGDAKAPGTRNSVHLLVTADGGQSWTIRVVPFSGAVPTGQTAGVPSYAYTQPGAGFTNDGILHVTVSVEVDDLDRPPTWETRSTDLGATWAPATMLPQAWSVRHPVGDEQFTLVVSDWLPVPNVRDEKTGTWSDAISPQDGVRRCNFFTPMVVGANGSVADGACFADGEHGTMFGMQLIALDLASRRYNASAPLPNPSCLPEHYAEAGVVVIEGVCFPANPLPTFNMTLHFFTVGQNLTWVERTGPLAAVPGYVDGSCTRVQEMKAGTGGIVHIVASACFTDPSNPGTVRLRTVYMVWDATADKLLLSQVLTDRPDVATDALGAGAVGRDGATSIGEAALAHQPDDASLDVNRDHALVVWNDDPSTWMETIQVAESDAASGQSI
jgi:hypothetical protein